MKELNKIQLSAIFIAIIIWVGFIVASGAGWNPLHIKWNFSNPGAFGDSFGPLSAFMAFIAALSAIAAYSSQQSEISRSKIRESLEDERRELEDKERLERQFAEDKANRISAFENTFFHLLDAFRGIVSETDIVGGTAPRIGRDAFKYMVRTMDQNTSTYNSNAEAWVVTAKHHENDLNHYFRFMYHIVSYVDLSEATDKYFYVRFLRSQLSEAELVLLALNCAYGEGLHKFKILVEKYSLLHNLSDSAQGRWRIRSQFDSRAFERT